MQHIDRCSWHFHLGNGRLFGQLVYSCLITVGSGALKHSRGTVSAAIGIRLEITVMFANHWSLSFPCRHYQGFQEPPLHCTTASASE